MAEDIRHMKKESLKITIPLRLSRFYTNMYNHTTNIKDAFVE